MNRIKTLSFFFLMWVIGMCIMAFLDYMFGVPVKWISIMGQSGIIIFVFYLASLLIEKTNKGES